MGPPARSSVKGPRKPPKRRENADFRLPLALFEKFRMRAGALKNDRFVIACVDQEKIAADMAFAMVGPRALERVIFPLRWQRTVIRDQQKHDVLQPAHIVAAGAREADPVFFERPGVVRRARP